MSHAKRRCVELAFFPCAALGKIHEARGEIPEAIAAHRTACETEYSDSCADAKRLANDPGSQSGGQ